MISKVIANFGSLAVVATAHPEHVGAAFVGQLCARRARGDLRFTFAGIDGQLIALHGFERAAYPIWLLLVGLTGSVAPSASTAPAIMNVRVHTCIRIDRPPDWRRR
jgi:hypothetical protein